MRRHDGRGRNSSGKMRAIGGAGFMSLGVGTPRLAPRSDEMQRSPGQLEPSGARVVFAPREAHERRSCHEAHPSPAERAVSRLGQSGATAVGRSDNVRLEVPPVSPKPLVERHHGVQDPVTNQCTLPHNGHAPASFLQFPLGAPVPLNVVFEFGLPELWSGGRRSCIGAPGMAVLEAAMDEADGSKSPKGEVRGSRQSDVEPDPDPICVQRAAERDLRLRVLGTDTRHHPRARRFVDDVRHPLAVLFSLRSEDVIPPESVESIKVSSTILRVSGNAAKPDAISVQRRHSEAQVLFARPDRKLGASRVAINLVAGCAKRVVCSRTGK